MFRVKIKKAAISNKEFDETIIYLVLAIDFVNDALLLADKNTGTIKFFDIADCIYVSSIDSDEVVHVCVKAGSIGLRFKSDLIYLVLGVDVSQKRILMADKDSGEIRFFGIGECVFKGYGFRR